MIIISIEIKTEFNMALTIVRKFQIPISWILMAMAGMFVGNA